MPLPFPLPLSLRPATVRANAPFRTLVALLVAALLLGACGDAGEPDLEVGAARAGVPAGGTSLITVRIDNRGDGDDQLLAVETPAAADIELHLTEIEGGQASMTQLDSIDIPANDRIEFVPGALHLMLVLPDETIAEGATFPMTLQFDRSDEQTVEVDVVPIADLLDDPA